MYRDHASLYFFPLFLMPCAPVFSGPLDPFAFAAISAFAFASVYASLVSNASLL